MARTPRGVVLDRADVGVYHCISRCVRRAFLCGHDPVSGQSFEHRRQWIQDRMQLLAGVFGIDVLAFAVMSNHLHVVLRNRPDVVKVWSDEEVARRWWRLFPLRRNEDGSPADMEPTDLAMLLTRQDVLRDRLGDVSWWMRCLSEGIARRANREDQCTGRFWEGRFKCQPLLDESALAACMAYVDLNPVRSGIAGTPETSRFTSIYERLKDERAQATREAGTGKAVSGKATVQDAQADSRAGWLAPLALAATDGQPARSSVDTSHPPPLRPAGVARSVKKPKGSHTSQRLPAASKSNTSRVANAWPSPAGLGRRASDQGCLPLTTAEYAALLDWTGRQIRKGKTGRIAPDLPPILARLQTAPESWLRMVEHFRTLFRTAAGRPSRLAEEATRRSRRWLHGTHSSRQLFGLTDSGR